MSINKPQTCVVGNLVADPDLRFTPSGVAVCKFRVLTTPRVKDGDSWKDGEPSGYNVTAWRELAEHAAESFTKGDRVIVFGELEIRQYDDKEGNRRTSVDLTADALGPELRFAIAKPQRQTSSGGSSGGSSAKARPNADSQRRQQADDDAPPW
jgi:single-strand DNA-binding protein